MGSVVILGDKSTRLLGRHRELQFNTKKTQEKKRKNKAKWCSINMDLIPGIAPGIGFC